jgi:ribonuclease BN (tRNA processing enzyme)
MLRLILSTFLLLLASASNGQIKEGNDVVPIDSSVLKVTLLGTGNPLPVMTRFGPSILVQAGGEILLFDAGRGCLSKTDPSYSRFAHHTTPEQAGKVFNAVKPKLAVYSHIGKLYGHNEGELLKRTKATYPGVTVIGEDLMTFIVRDSVSISRWKDN